VIVAGIIGATGYAGSELVRLLSSHPQVSSLVLASTSFEGGAMESVYPNLRGIVSAKLVQSAEVVPASDVVFAALPHGVGEDYAAACVEKGIPFIDLSADFRFGDDEETFAAWYGKGFRKPELRTYATYGLCEINRAAIAKARIIGNPGCYPTAATLALAPALSTGLIGPGTLIVDAASGVTGAGRSPSQSTHFPDCAESLAPYKVGAHRHSPEIQRNLSEAAGHPVNLVFTPHLAPMSRGILATCYAPLAAGAATGSSGAVKPPSDEIHAVAQRVRDAYAKFYEAEPFVRVLPYGETATTRNVRLSNYCDLSIHVDPSASTLIVSSAIDNMVKGAAGQAVQNMNIVLGFPETAGLTGIPAAF